MLRLTNCLCCEFRVGINVDKKLKVISEPSPGSRTLLLHKNGEVLPLIKCDADLNLLCGKCDSVLVEGIVEDQIKNVVIRCPVCQRYNEIT
jgi:hypothetical protein